jgi:hypothetical protein
MRGTRTARAGSAHGIRAKAPRRQGAKPLRALAPWRLCERSLSRTNLLTSLLLAAVLAISCAEAPAGPVAPAPAPPSGREPAPPAVLLDTRFDYPAGRTIRVEPDDRAPEPGALQAALDEARPGDTIELRAGGVYAGNFVLPAKSGFGWIVVRAGAAAGVPDEGTRVGPAAAGSLPKILTPNAMPAIATAPRAHHYRLVGIEIGLAPGVAANNGIVVFGDADQKAGEVPHDLVVDRCYVHGTPTAEVLRGVVLNSARSAVVDSYVSDVHSAHVDAQAILGWCGPGPFKILNNYLEASGENTMFGGADPKTPNLVPSDIEFRGNHSAKPLSWRPGDPAFAGRTWSVKNLFELKNARRVVVADNLFENAWPSSQNGFAILFTVRNQDGNAPWSVVEDVTFTGNTVRRAAGGVNILGRDDTKPSAQARRIAIRDNLFDEIGPAGWETPGRFLLISDAVDVTVDHNTVLHAGNAITAHGTPSPGFVFTNNLMRHNEYGIIGDNTGVGSRTVAVYFPNAVLRRNVLAGGKASDYPDDNLFPGSLEAAGLVDRGGGHYRLSPGSPLRAAGLDGADVGCDLRRAWAREGAARSGVREGGQA